MRHQRRVRRLGRTSSHHKALLISLSTALFDKERIETTLPKAKQLRAYAEKLITKAKKGGLANRRLILRDIKDKDVVAKLMDTLAPRFAERPGGYTRILKTGFRNGDASEMAIIELVEPYSVSKSEASAENDKKSDGKKAKTDKKKSLKTVKTKVKKEPEKAAKPKKAATKKETEKKAEKKDPVEKVKKAAPRKKAAKAAPLKKKTEKTEEE